MLALRIVKVQPGETIVSFHDPDTFATDYTTNRGPRMYYVEGEWFDKLANARKYARTIVQPGQKIEIVESVTRG